MPAGDQHIHYKSMHRARLSLRTQAKDEIKARGKMTHNELLRYFMLEGLLCRQVAENYIQDMLFVGELLEKSDIITMPPLK
jgi:hypothetical protein